MVVFHWANRDASLDLFRGLISREQDRRLSIFDHLSDNGSVDARPLNQTGFRRPSTGRGAAIGLIDEINDAVGIVVSRNCQSHLISLTKISRERGVQGTIQRGRCTGQERRSALSAPAMTPLSPE
ncbi:hypothetical protein BRAS3843_2770068 [Bradyrhizobium sp. STM 3843]|nr:hypothetical protein BRAS3843_2770068 [Bradyrhizobium sp. STM 3843]